MSYDISLCDPIIPTMEELYEAAREYNRIS